MASSLDGKERKKPAIAGLILPVLAAVYAVYYVLSVQEFPWEAQIFGVAIAVVLWILVAWFVARTLIGVVRGKIRWGGWSDLPAPSDLARRAGFIGLTIADVALIGYLGFALTVFLFVLFSMLLLGVRSRRMLILMPPAVSLSGYLLFVVLLQADLPAGPVDAVLGWIH